MRYLVTGATGLLGNNLVRQLLEEGHDVRVLARPPVERKELSGLDVDTVVGQLDDAELLQAAFANVDCVVHAAAMIHIGKRRLQESRAINVELTKRLASLANRHQVKMIHVSSVDALAAGKKDEPATEADVEPMKVACSYVISKREADAAILDEVANGLDASLVYPGLMFGAWDWKPSSGQMILALANQYVPFGPRGGISAVDVQDVATGIIQASKVGGAGERYLMTGHNLPYVELWKKIAGLLGRPKPLCRMGPAFAWTVGQFGDLWTMIRGKEGDVNSAGIKLSNLYHYYDVSKSEAELGYKVSPLEPCLERAIAFLRQQQMIK